MSNRTVQVHGETLSVIKTTLPNGKLDIRLTDEQGIPYATLTIQVDSPTLDHFKHIVAVKTYSENESLVEPLLQSGLFRDLGISIPVGMTRANVWEVLF